MDKASIWTIALALALVGCNGNDSNSATSSEYPTTKSNNSDTNNDSNSIASNNQTSDTNAASNNAPPTQSSTGTTDNPSRVYQLKDLKKIVIKTPGGDLKLWLMDTESKRQEGMMFLVDREVKDDEGMLFLFPEVQKLSGNYSFWMHNTILPLDIDYIGKDKRVVNVGKGMPFSDDKVPQKGDYFYVIEVKQGLSGKFGLSAGSKVNIPADLIGLP